MSQQISHSLDAESHTNSNNVFSLPTDASAADCHVRSRLAPLVPCNFPGMAAEVIFSTQEVKHRGIVFEEVQDEFKGSMASFSQLALL